MDVGPGGVRVEIFSDPRALAVGAARRLIHSANSAIHSHGTFRIALAGGSTPKSLYRCLASQFRSATDWTKVHFYWGDERNVPNDDSQSNFKMSWDTLLQPLEIGEANIHRVWSQWGSRDPATAPAPAVAARDYDTLLAHTPVLDFVLLGLGEDGHTASLMPDARPDPFSHIDEDRRVIELWIPHLNDFRISMTANFINRANEVAFLVSGSEKSEILSRVLKAEKRYPSQLIHPASGKLSWWVDRAAAAQLESPSLRSLAI